MMTGAGSGILGNGITLMITHTSPKSRAGACPRKQRMLMPCCPVLASAKTLILVDGENSKENIVPLLASASAGRLFPVEKVIVQTEGYKSG